MTDYIVKRDQSGAVLNTNRKQLLDYKKRRDILLEKEVRIDNMETRLEELELLVRKLING